MNTEDGGTKKRRQKAPFYGAFFMSWALIAGFSLSVGFSAYANDSKKVSVRKVIDGDTVKLQGGEVVRLLGINAPEKDFENRPAQPLSLQATLLLRELVEGQSVTLTKDQEQEDKYGRTLGYLDLLDGTDVQQALVSRGYAFVVAFPPNIDRLQLYQDTELQAREQNKGIWKESAYFPTVPSKHQKLRGGFGFVTGTVEKVRFSKKNVRLSLSEHMVVGIRHQAWEEYWQGDAQKLVGKTVVARGWIQGARGNQPAYLRVRHPAMMEIQ